MKKNGFTLVELLAVIALLGILATLLLTNAFGIFDSSKKTINQIQLNALKDSLRYYATAQNIQNCNVACTNDDDIFDVCVTNTSQCKSNTKTSITTTIQDLIDKQYFVDNGQSCGPRDAPISVYKQDNAYYYDISAVNCYSNDDSISSSSTIVNTVVMSLAIAANTTAVKSLSNIITITSSSYATTNSYQYYLSNSSTSLSGGTWTNYTNGTNFTMGTGLTGTYYLFVKQVSDTYGNVSKGGSIITISSINCHKFGAYIFDNTAPIIASFNIGSASSSITTTTNSVAYLYLTSSSSDAYQMCFTSTTSSASCTWKTYSTGGSAYTLILGTNTVYAFVKDSLGNISSSLNRGITYTLLSTLKGPNADSSYTGEYYAYKSQITSITIQNVINVPSTTYKFWYVAADGSSNVIAYLVSDGGVGYSLYIQGNGGMYAPINSSYLFLNFAGVTSINGLQYLNTSKTTSMYFMFASLYNISSIDVSTFDTSNVTNMGGLFSSDAKLSSLNVNAFNTSKVTNMYAMFSYCTSLTSLNLSSFNTSNVTNMVSMFGYNNKLTTINISSFNTSNVTIIYDMFYNCSSLTLIDFRNATFGSATTYSNMFSGAKTGLTIYVKDSSAKSFISSRLNDASITATVTIV